MKIRTIARIIEEAPGLTEQDDDGVWRNWTNHRTGTRYSVEYTDSEFEDAVTVAIHRGWHCTEKTGGK